MKRSLNIINIIFIYIINSIILKKIKKKNNKWKSCNDSLTQFKMEIFNISHILYYYYDKKRYIGTFLLNKVNITDRNFQSEKINRVIYCFWTGENKLTPNRVNGLKSLQKNSGVKVELITPKNLSKYIKPDDPLPEGYKYLSLIHKADYLRTYFMHHYGGGYADIKTFPYSWNGAFDKLENSNAYAIGYPEIGPIGVAQVENKNLKEDMKNYWRLLISNCAYIFRPYTKFTKAWLDEAKRRIKMNLNKLKNHPAKNPFGTNKDYPIKWTYILGQIFHPLCLKYHDKILQDSSLKFYTKNYK